VWVSRTLSCFPLFIQSTLYFLGFIILLNRPNYCGVINTPGYKIQVRGPLQILNIRGVSVQLLKIGPGYNSLIFGAKNRLTFQIPNYNFLIYLSFNTIGGRGEVLTIRRKFHTINWEFVVSYVCDESNKFVLLLVLLNIYKITRLFTRTYFPLLFI